MEGREFVFDEGYEFDRHKERWSFCSWFLLTSFISDFPFTLSLSCISPTFSLVDVLIGKWMNHCSLVHESVHSNLCFFVHSIAQWNIFAISHSTENLKSDWRAPRTRSFAVSCQFNQAKAFSRYKSVQSIKKGEGGQIYYMRFLNASKHFFQNFVSKEGEIQSKWTGNYLQGFIKICLKMQIAPRNANKNWCLI